MNFDAARAIGREPHGSSDDESLMDFSANTHPRSPDGVETVYHAAFECARSYPTEPPTAFRDAAAEYVDCDSSQVVPTPGGLAAIRATVALSVDEGDSVLVPSPSFAEYSREIELLGGKPHFDSHNSILAADPGPHSLAIVCNPNNPTGNAYADDALRAFAERCRDCDTTLLIDEAFLGFTDRPSLAGVEGVVVARSLTKLFGLPGLRAGFAVATGDLRDALANARRPWNVGVPALATGEYCMQQTAFVAETRERVRAERSRMRTALEGTFDVLPSDAPFLLVNVGDRSVSGVLDHARENGLALRDARTFRELDSHLRVAVREPAENDRLLEVLGNV